MTDDPSVSSAAELRAIVAQGPAVVTIAGSSLLAILDERDRLRAELAECRAEAAEQDGAGLRERGA